MSAIEDVDQALDTAVGRLIQSETATAQAAAMAGRGLELAETVGLPAAIEKLRRVTVTTASAVDELAAVTSRLRRAQELIQALADPGGSVAPPAAEPSATGESAVPPAAERPAVTAFLVSDLGR
jgi:hypothetical protein